MELLNPPRVNRVIPGPGTETPNQPLFAFIRGSIPPEPQRDGTAKCPSYFYAVPKTPLLPLGRFACRSRSDTLYLSAASSTRCAERDILPLDVVQPVSSTSGTYRGRYKDLPCSWVIHTCICPALRSRSGLTNLGLPRFTARTYCGLFDTAPLYYESEGPDHVRNFGTL